VQASQGKTLRQWDKFTHFDQLMIAEAIVSHALRSAASLPGVKIIHTPQCPVFLFRDDTYAGEMAWDPTMHRAFADGARVRASGNRHRTALDEQNACSRTRSRGGAEPPTGFGIYGFGEMDFRGCRDKTNSPPRKRNIEATPKR
jgi:hypothetical protein